MQSDLLDRIRRTIRKHRLAGPETRVVAAVSGGSDSVALAHLLHALDRAGELRFCGVAHFNHQLRPAADDEEGFCAALSTALERPFLSDRQRVAERARAEGRSLEDAARAARYEFFERARTQFAADAVALGHTRDDQAETFLLRLLRGAGARGLAGMHPHRGTIIRPLIECRRAMLQTYLAAQAIPYASDESNDDVRIPRNRVRAELLPFLESRFNPRIVDVLADEADIAREEWRWMDGAAREVATRLYRRDAARRCLDADALAALPPALARLIVRAVLDDVSPERSATLAHVEEVLRLAREGGRAIDLPGCRAERQPSEVVLSQPGAPPANFFRYPLSIPGVVEIREAGWLVSAEVAGSAADAVLSSRATAVVQLDRYQAPLAVRSRRPGDRFRPLGLHGRKKLQDFFVDRKVERNRRDQVPLVVDDRDRIVWVAGHTIDHEFRVTDRAQAVLILRLKEA